MIFFRLNKKIIRLNFEVPKTFDFFFLLEVENKLCFYEDNNSGITKSLGYLQASAKLQTKDKWPSLLGLSKWYCNKNRLKRVCSETSCSSAQLAAIFTTAWSVLKSLTGLYELFHLIRSQRMPTETTVITAGWVHSRALCQTFYNNAEASFGSKHCLIDVLDSWYIQKLLYLNQDEVFQTTVCSVVMLVNHVVNLFIEKLLLLHFGFIVFWPAQISLLSPTWVVSGPCDLLSQFWWVQLTK